MRRTLSILLVCLALASLSAGAEELTAGAKIAPWLMEQLEGGRKASFLVLLDEPVGFDFAAAPADLYPRLTVRARATQKPLLEWLAAQGIRARRFYLVNALKVEGDLGLARALALRPEVRRLAGNPTVRGVPVPGPFLSAEGTLAVEWGVGMVEAPEAWSRGIRGEGVVVMSADTGVEWAHPALVHQYRGFDPQTGGVDHRYSWHDAIDDSPAPWDDNGHGTHTVGTMAGDDGDENQVGVAPGARWVGCRNMDHGYGSPATYIECLEWALAPYPPGGDPLADGRPDLAPHIGNNSWVCPMSEGCDWDTLQAAFARMRQAGIWQIAAAGNSGSGCGTIGNPPAIYEEVQTVAAVKSGGALASFSSRGPVDVDGSFRPKPDLSAPGEGVRSCARNGGYTSMSGTSMASPHVSGVAALLWSAAPALRGLVGPSRCLLERSARTPVGNSVNQSCGGTPSTVYPNNMAGWGIVAAAAALDLPNGDGDPVADACDCAPADGQAFALPVEVQKVLFAPLSASRLTWDSQAPTAGAGTRYDLARGELAALLSSGTMGQAVCLAPDLGAPFFDDPARPAPGGGFYYLVRAFNPCGLSHFGSSSAGAPRAVPACD